MTWLMITLHNAGVIYFYWHLAKQKMFRNPLVAVMHFFVYAGFIIINIAGTGIVLDGILGNHRLFAEPLGGLYSFSYKCSLSIGFTCTGWLCYLFNPQEYNQAKKICK
jgi:hypothetical protein